MKTPSIKTRQSIPETAAATESFVSIPVTDSLRADGRKLSDCVKSNSRASTSRLMHSTANVSSGAGPIAFQSELRHAGACGTIDSPKADRSRSHIRGARDPVCHPKLLEQSAGNEKERWRRSPSSTRFSIDLLEQGPITDAAKLSSDQECKRDPAGNPDNPGQWIYPLLDGCLGRG